MIVHLLISECAILSFFADIREEMEFIKVFDEKKSIYV